MNNCKNITKEERMKKEFNRLKRIFKDIGKDRKDTMQTLISNAAFMTITLEDLQEQINQNGVLSEYKNGENQWGTKKSPEVEIYNTMIKNQTAIIRQLVDLLPDEKAQDASEELLNFAFSGKKKKLAGNY